jgi:periplasmic protein TonB
MSERKPCIRCERAIDQWSKICPFCNWDQSQAVPANNAQQIPHAAATYVPPDEFAWKKKALMAAGAVVMLIASFGVGAWINSDGAPKKAPESVVAQSAEEAQRAEALRHRADTPLVPIGEGGIEQPITSAPAVTAQAQGATAPSGYDRSDATAVSSVEYQQLAQRAKAEKDRMAALVDPRSLTGPAYAQGPVRAPVRRAPARPPLMASAPSPVPNAAPPQQATVAPPEPALSPREQAARNVRGGETSPVPEYQPIPSLSTRGRARLDLVVGPDGRVKQVNVRNAVRGTAELINAVRSWRFRPAMSNGHPVTGTYNVEISFGGNG